MRDRGRGDAVRDGDGGMTEGCKDTLFVLLHIDAVVATHGRDIHTAHTHIRLITANYQQHNASGGLLKGPSSLTRQFWDLTDKILNC